MELRPAILNGESKPCLKIPKQNEEIIQGQIRDWCAAARARH